VKEQYVIVTAARNEERYIRFPLDAVTQQTHLPHKWVIVSDNSTDKTEDIVNSYVNNFPFIQLLKNTGKDGRNFGSQIKAIQRGLEELSGINYLFVGNLDADVSFSKTYFETLIQRLKESPKLGLTGGYICEENADGVFRARPNNTSRSVAHAIQLFRRECFEQIGGYQFLRYGGADSLAEIASRMHGWEVLAHKDLEVRHHKPTLASEGILKGAFRQGLMDFSMGNILLFELARCLRRVSRYNLGAYAFCRFAGFLWGRVADGKHQLDPEIHQYWCQEQKRRLFSFVQRRQTFSGDSDNS
jgi:glycosyltransferase involved in cell wall biosynthesis